MAGRLSESVFLLDVDGTLLTTGTSYHGQAIEWAVEQATGRRVDAHDIYLAGRTDSEILADMLARAGVERSEELLTRLFELAADAFRQNHPPDLRWMVLPGVRRSLERLRSEGGRLGLVTGNIAAIGWEKMRATGLDEFFAFGAFGDESSRRADLPPLAIGRSGGHFSPDRSYIIGDTPLDIACGAACSMKTVAVATGRYSLEELRAHHPTFACRFLPEFVDAMLEGRV
ncbi:MAG: HAD family hydrolase [Chloroflexota bacterium]